MNESVFLHRTPSKTKSPKKEGEVDIVELLRGHDPKDYEKILRDHDIHDYRAILEAISFLKKEKEDETGKVVRIKLRSQVCLTGKLCDHLFKKLKKNTENCISCPTGSGAWWQSGGGGHG